jgi:hypothetical protein
VSVLAELGGWIRFAALVGGPGLAAAFALFPDGLRRPGFHGVALALGPPLLGASTALALGMGVPLAAAAHVVLIPAAALTATGFARRSRKPRGPIAPFEVGPFIAAAAVALLCAAIPAAFEWWRVSSDAWTHEGVVRTLVRDGVPPGDPWYAGLTLRYAWIYHAAVAALEIPGGPDRFALMAGLAVVSVTATLLSASDLAALWNPGARGWTLLLLVLGLNALFPAFLPLHLLRALTGDVRGLEAVSGVFDLTPFGWDRVGAFLRSLGGQDFFLNKFLVATPLSLALACYTAWLEAVARAIEEARPANTHVLAAGLLAAGGGLLHPVVGLHLAALVGLAGAASLLALSGDTGRRALAVLFGSAFGLVPVAWFVLTFVRTGEGGHAGLPFDLAPLKLLGLATCLALGLAFGIRRLGHDFRAGGAARWRTFLVLGSLAVAAVIRLPGPSPFFTVDKFAYLAWIPLALASGPAFARFVCARTVPVRFALVVLLFLPVNGLALASRVTDPRVSSRQPWDWPDFLWLRRTLPEDAVLLVPPRDIDLGVFAQRDQYDGIAGDAQLRGYAEAEIGARQALVAQVFAEGTLSEAQRRRLAALGRPVYAVWIEGSDPMWRDMPGQWSRESAPPAPLPARWKLLGHEVYRGHDLRVVEIVSPLGGTR